MLRLTFNHTDLRVLNPKSMALCFRGDSISITITPHENYQFDQWSGTVSSFESTITLFGTKDHHLTASLVETPDLTDRVLVYNGPRIDPNPIFAVRLGAKSSVVFNKQGEIVTEYEFENPLGNDFEMLPNGEFLGIFKPENRNDFTFSGSVGILRRVTADQQTLWEYTIASKTELAHHDVELLPNGNVMTIVWEKIPLDKACTNLARSCCTYLFSFYSVLLGTFYLSSSAFCHSRSL